MKDILVILVSFFLFVCASLIGTHTLRDWNSYHIICPSEEQGEALVQSMSDGMEVLCIYSKDPMQKGRSSYKSGKLSPLQSSLSN